MSINTHNISQEDVCIWFKSHLEGHSRIELMCSLLDICLPLELRFLGTYLEYAAGKHHVHLQKWEKDANNPTSFSVTDLSDATTRRRLCLFLTLLHSHNKTIATKLFDVLSLYENLASLIQITSASNAKQVDQHQSEDEKETSTEYDSTSWNEFKLLLTLSSLHPAFSFNQRLVIREKLEQFIALTDGSSSFSPEKSSAKSEVKFENGQAATETAPPPLTEASNTVLLVNDGSSATALPMQGNVQKQGLLPTPLLQLHEVHYPHYIPVPGNFSPHPGQPILIPTSSITVLNQQDQMLCVQSAPNIPININNNAQYTPQNVAFHKVNTIISKNNSDVLSQTLPSQQDVILNTQFSTFPHDGTSKRSDDVTMKQPVLLQHNHISPFQIINNNFHHSTNKVVQSGDIHSNWRNTEKNHDANNSESKKRTDKNTRGSVSDLRGSSSDLDLLSRRSFSETDVCETTSINNIHVVPSRPVPSDSPNNIHRNTNNLSDYKISYKSKLIGSPYTHVPDASILTTNQTRPILLPKNITEINNIRNVHPNSSQHITPLTLHKINQINESNVTHSSGVITSVLTVSYSHKESIVSSMSKLHSPQVYISADKQTLPTGINGGYLQSPVCQDSYHSNTTVTVSDNLPRPASNPNHLFADNKNIHSKISPISIQVHRKTVSTNNNHILSPAGSGKFSNDCFDSPITSPSHSPRRSPYSSPSNSPMSHRKDYNSKHIDAYSSASNWLKSLRLHKYSDKFEGYTFQMMKDLTDEALAELITTKGAQSKFKQNVDQLVKRGFKEFGCTDNLSVNEDSRNSPVNHISPLDGSLNNKLKNTDVTMGNDVQSFLLSPVLNSHPPPHAYQNMHSFYNNDINDLQNHPAKPKVQESSPLIRAGGFFEDLSGRLMSETYVDDDSYEEVLTTRKQISNLATCYNCGAKGHYGHQCIEETMEAQTYSRYAFQLDFSRRDSFTNTESKAASASISSR